MQIDLGKIAAVRSAVGASVHITVQLTYPGGDEAPLSAMGYLQTQDGHRISVLREEQWSPNPNMLRARSTQRNAEKVRRMLTLATDFSRAQIDFLERLRDRTPRKSLLLSALVRVRLGKCHADVSEGDGARLSESPSGLLEFPIHEDTVKLEILASQWVDEFAPKFGLGTFAVFEIPDPDDVEALVGADAELAELMGHAIASARAAKARLVLIFPRFRGHPNWRDNAPGVIHGQTKEAA